MDSYLAKGLLYLLAQVFPGIAAIFTLAVYTRWLPAEAYGIYSTLIVVVTATNLMLFNWLYVSIYRFWNDGQLSERDMQSVTLTALSGISLLAVVVLLPVAWWTQQYALIGAFAALLVCGAFFSAYQRINAIQQHAGRILAAEMQKVSVASLLGVCLVWLGYSWPGIVIGLCLGFIFASLLSRHFRRLFFVRPRLNNPALFRRLLLYGLPLSLTYMLLEIIQASDRVLLSWLLGVEFAGQYAAALSLPYQMLLMLANAVGLALYPRIIQLFEQQGVQQAAAQLGQYFLLLTGVLVPAYLGLIAIRDDFFPLILGAGYVDNALLLLPWLGLAVVMNAMYLFYVSYAFQLSHQTAATIRIVLVAALINIVLNSLLIPVMGTLGAAIATLMAYVVCVFYGFWVGQKYFPLWINRLALCQIILSALLMFSLLELLPLPAGWWAGLLRIVTGIVVYTGLVLLLDIAGIRELVFSHYKRLLAGGG